MAGCTFPPGQELRLRVSLPRGAWLNCALLSSGLVTHLLIYPVIHKYLLSSFCAPGTVLSMGVTEVETHKNLCPHRAFLLVKEENQQMSKIYSVLVK